MMAFDKVYCICMKDRPKKKENLFRQLAHHFPEWDPALFKAIDTRHLKNHFVGCTLSHRSVIHEAKQRGYNNILVFEEDAILRQNFRELFIKNIKDQDFAKNI